VQFHDLAAFVAVIATIVGSTVRLMIKLNQMDRELLELRREFSGHRDRIVRIERKVGIEQ